MAQIAGYYGFLWARVQSVNEKELLTELPATLQLQVALVLNKTLFTRVPIFKDMEAQCIVAFVRRLRPVICTPDQIVVKEGVKAAALSFISVFTPSRFDPSPSTHGPPLLLYTTSTGIVPPPTSTNL